MSSRGSANVRRSDVGGVCRAVNEAIPHHRADVATVGPEGKAAAKPGNVTRVTDEVIAVHSQSPSLLRVEHVRHDHCLLFTTDSRVVAWAADDLEGA